MLWSFKGPLFCGGGEDFGKVVVGGVGGSCEVECERRKGEEALDVSSTAPYGQST